MTKHLQKTVVAVILFLATNSFAQLWCPLNSEWYYTRSWPGTDGYVKISFTGTALVNNTVCQKLNYYSEYYKSTSPVGVGSITSTYYTYVNDSVVYFYTTAQTFDTLYNFKARVGDSWLLPRYTLANCERYKVQVADTGHKLVQGINLKWLKLSAANYGDTIFERIGSCFIFSMIHPQNCDQTDFEYGGPLRCYSDYQISNFKKYNGECDFYLDETGISELEKSELVVFKPNPVKDRLTVNLKQLNYTSVRLMNAKGQLLFTKEVNDPGFTIDFANFDNGLYFLLLDNTSGKTLCKKIVKD